MKLLKYLFPLSVVLYCFQTLSYFFFYFVLLDFNKKVENVFSVFIIILFHVLNVFVTKIVFNYYLCFSV